MKRLNKRFEASTDNLQAFLNCSCPYIQCGCENIYDQTSIDSATDMALQASIDWQALSIAR